MEGYYGKRAGIYLEDVRRFVPVYDEMVAAIIGVAKSVMPREILDIGPGPGHIDAELLEAMPDSRVTCVESSAEMAGMSVTRLSRFGSKARVVAEDVNEFEPGQKYDMAIANLVLHNIDPRYKPRLLARIRSWLSDGGTFVWGDMIRREDEGRRLARVLRLGANRKLAEETVEKERKDILLGEDGVKEAAESAGFRDFSPAWKRGCFAVFRMKK